MKIAHKSLQTCRCKAAVRPKRTKSGTNNSGNNPDGKINLIAAIDSREVSRTVSSRNTLWQSNESLGSLNQTLHMTNVNVPANNTNFQAAGGISVQLPKGAKLPQQIATLAKQPGNEYLTDLAKRSDIDWKQVEVINKTWDHKKSGLTQEAVIIVAIVVTIFTAGAASSAGAAMATAAGESVAVAATATTAAVAGTTAGAVIAGATSAAITTLATQAAIAILNNKGDIAGALKEMHSKENVKGLATAVITAGLVQGIGVQFGLDQITAKSPFIEQLGANLVNGVAGSLVSTAINGGSLEDNLKNAIKTALISTAGAQLANGIGNITNDNQLSQTDIEKFANKFAHAVLGCAVGAATADSKAGCGAGALGAVAGSLGAELFDPANVKGAQAQQFGKLTAALAVLLVGGDAKLMNIGGLTAVNAVANNRQLHPKEVDRIKELADLKAKETCKGNAECYRSANLYWTDMLQGAAEGRVDNAIAKNNNDYYNQVINAAGIPGSEANVSGASVFYFNNLKAAQEILNSDAGKPIIMPNGQVQLGSDGKPQTYFSATDAQKADPYGNVFPGGSPGSTVSGIPGKAQRDLDRLERLTAINGGVTPIYTAEELLLGGAVGGKVLGTLGRFASNAERAAAEAELATTAAGKYANRTNIQTSTAEQANATFPENFKPPYQPGTRVVEYVNNESEQFVRVSLGDESAGRWMMRKEAIEGLSPEQIASKYSLPAVPKYITDVNVPAGSSIRTGHVETNFGGNKGAVQYQLLRPIPESSFVNTRPLN